MFLGACTKAPHFCIVLEYCESGTLWSLLQQKNTELCWEERRRLALDTAKGMNYLHERSTPVLHRDLKSLNLLLD
jgi:sterile alpha motif and leucine zipper containing kinase AZK